MDVLVWLSPALFALLLYGVGQGLVKKYAAEVPPARYCLYFLVAKSIVNLGFFLTREHGDPFSPEGRAFMIAGILAYVLDGAGWILYFASIVAGPITIVGTLSAVYPAVTVVLARVFLGEALIGVQYVGVALVIAGCVGLSYAPAGASTKVTAHRWIPLAAAAVLLWGAAQTIVKYAYTLPAADETNLALFNTIGGAMTLGIFGVLKGREGALNPIEWRRSFLPMAMMAGGDLAVIVASQKGPISIVTPISGAYPLVTVAFAWVVLKERLGPLQWGCVISILVGIFLASGQA